MTRPPLYWSRRLVRPVAVVLAAGVLAPFVLRPVLGSSGDRPAVYVGIVATVAAAIGLTVLALPMGLSTASLARAEGSVLTVQTLRGPRSIDLGRLARIRTTVLYGRSGGGTSVFWRITDSDGASVTFPLAAGERPAFFDDLLTAVISLAESGGQRPSLRVRKELQLNEQQSAAGRLSLMGLRVAIELVKYVATIFIVMIVLFGLVELYSLVGIPIS